MDKKVVIFGEMLWDCFSDKNIPGGAPMNVALHSQYLGLLTTFISKVGQDKLGEDLVEFVRKKALDTTQIQQDSIYETGKVIVDDRNREDVKYDILKPVAWDFINWTPEIQEKVDQADAFVFGSLAARDEVSRDTLLKLLETPTLKIFDINLRAPHYDFEVLEKLLDKTDILKINDDELEILADFKGFLDDRETALEKLADTYDLQMICVTKGSQGAEIYDRKNKHLHSGYHVEVLDTVGAGDAFLSGFIFNYLKGGSPEKILEFACALGALVATQKGGTPQYDLDEVKAIIHNKSSQ